MAGKQKYSYQILRSQDVSFSLNCYRESEEFEAIAIKHVDALLKDAYTLRENLNSQKQALIASLKDVTSILEKSSSEDSEIM